MAEPVMPKGSAATGGDSPARIGPCVRGSYWPWVAMAALMAGSIYQLRSQGRLWWCACGQLSLWSGNTWSQHNSQHLIDPYSFTHMLHGMVLCGLVVWVCPRLPFAWRLWFAVLIEAVWEIVENMDFVIQRYRAVTASLDYQGDTVANSLGDILSFGVGVAIARYLGFWRSLGLFLVTEVVLLFWIRDGLLLNVLMLLYPIDAVRAWQMGH
jgi:Protein of unknown function (DUF2585)